MTRSRSPSVASERSTSSQQQAHNVLYCCGDYAICLVFFVMLQAVVVPIVMLTAGGGCPSSIGMGGCVAIYLISIGLGLMACAFLTYGESIERCWARRRHT